MSIAIRLFEEEDPHARPQWSTDMVAERIREAWDTLRRLPGQIGPEDRTFWPDIIRDYCESYGYETASVRLSPASPAAIDRMHQMFGWFRFLEGERDLVQAVWLTCGCGMGSRRAGDVLGVSRWTVRTRRNEALRRICDGIHRKGA